MVLQVMGRPAAQAAKVVTAGPEVAVRVRVSPEFFGRRGGWAKACGDLRDRIAVIRTLGYNFDAYLYAFAVFFVNISPGWLKKILYKRLR